MKLYDHCLFNLVTDEVSEIRTKYSNDSGFALYIYVKTPPEQENNIFGIFCLGQQEAGENQSIPRGKKKTLHDLFRPPIDLLHKGTFDTVRKVDFWNSGPFQYQSHCAGVT